MYTAINLRKSTKHFSNEPMSTELKDSLFAYIDQTSIPFTSKKIDAHFIEDGIALQKKFKGLTKMYGKLNSPHFIALSSTDSVEAREAIGYLGEMIVLHLITKNIASCWIANIKPLELPISLADKHQVYALIAIGRPVDPIRPVMSRNRQPIDYFVKGDFNADMIPVIESVIAAPSTRNSQPWQFEFENSHLIYQTTEPLTSLFSKQKQNYNDLNRGIGLAHLLVSLEHHQIAYTIQSENKRFTITMT